MEMCRMSVNVKRNVKRAERIYSVQEKCKEIRKNSKTVGRTVRVEDER